MTPADADYAQKQAHCREVGDIAGSGVAGPTFGLLGPTGPNGGTLANAVPGGAMAEEDYLMRG